MIVLSVAIKLKMSLHLSDHKVLHNIASSSSLFRFCSDSLAFNGCISYFKLLETIIPFALVGYETGYVPCWLFTISYPTCAHGIIIVK